MGEYHTNNYYGGQHNYDHTQQEEEWDREGLLDPAWEKQQKKVFNIPCFLVTLLLFFAKKS